MIILYLLTFSPLFVTEKDAKIVEEVTVPGWLNMCGWASKIMCFEQKFTSFSLIYKRAIWSLHA